MTAIAKLSTKYAPDVYRALNGIILVHKPANISHNQLSEEVRSRIVDGLNQLEPRPLATKLIASHEENVPQFLEVPNLADHPLVVGPRYVPWELSLLPFKPLLGYRQSGVAPFAVGAFCGKFINKIKYTKLINIYHITGKFGYMTDNCYDDGKILDKTTYDHIRPSKFDVILSRIETSQTERLFDSANVMLSSQEAYELAKAWPSRPPKMAEWPVIYRIRRLDLNLPEFKLEVTISNENEEFLSQLVHEVGIMNKTSAYTESIKRVKLGMFSIDDCLTSLDWNLQAFIDSIGQQYARRFDISNMFKEHRGPKTVTEAYKPRYQKDDNSHQKRYNRDKRN